MSYANWDELVLICMELAKYDKEKAAINEIVLIRKPLLTERNPRINRETVPAIKLGEAAGYH